MSRGVGIGILLAAVMFGTAAAQDAKDKKQDPDAIFTKLDTNHDNKLSKDEFLKLADFGKDKQKAREFLGKAFDKIADRETRGVNRDQFRKFLTELRKKKNDAPSS